MNTAKIATALLNKTAQQVETHRQKVKAEKADQRKEAAFYNMQSCMDHLANLTIEKAPVCYVNMWLKG